MQTSQIHSKQINFAISGFDIHIQLFVNDSLTLRQFVNLS